ncbi:MAG: MauE/DoxX family redox-associated membrane protein [Desulfovibrionales bacterium]
MNRINRYLAFCFRLYLGGLFVYASLYKINFPAEFAESIASYQILPYAFVNITAIVLPWVELLTGALLILGIRSKAAVSLIGVMLLFFTVAIVLSLTRDVSISCGCFQSLEEEMSWRTFFRDVAWLLMAVHVYFFDNILLLERRFSLRLREVE